MPKAKKKSPPKPKVDPVIAELELIAQAETQFVEVLHSTSPEAQKRYAKAEQDRLNLQAAGRAVFEGFIREAGYEHNALVPAWDKLKTFQQARWRTVARNAIDAANGMLQTKPTPA